MFLYIFLNVILFPLRGEESRLATILEMSSSKQSLILDRGSNHEIKPNDLAIFYVKKRPNNMIKDYWMEEVARGKVILVKENSSYWYLNQVRDAEALRVSKHVIYISLSTVNKGRSRPSILHSQIVLRETQNVNNIQETHEDGLPSNFTRKKNLYRESEKSIMLTRHDPIEITSQHFTTWKKDSPVRLKEIKGETEVKYFDSVSENRFKGQIESKEEEDFLSSSADSSIDYHNQKQFYGNDLEEQHTYEEDLTDASLQRLKESDLRWSQDLTDEELRKYFIESGSFREHKRQKFAMQNSIATEFVFKYGSSMVKHASENDLGQKETGKFWGLGIEYHLLRLSENFRRWTLDLYYEKAVGYYTLDELLSKSDIKLVADEKYYKAGINFYLYNYPSSLYALQAFVGGRIGFGSAQVKYVEYGEMDNYAITVFPQVHAGLKYRFKAQDESKESGFGLGLSSLLSYELIQFKMDNKKTDDSSGSFDISDLKLSVGLVVFF